MSDQSCILKDALTTSEQCLDKSTARQVHMITEAFGTADKVASRLLLSREDSKLLSNALAPLQHVKTKEQLEQALSIHRNTQLSWIPSKVVLEQLRSVPSLLTDTGKALDAVQDLYHQNSRACDWEIGMLALDQRRSLNWQLRLHPQYCNLQGESHGAEDVIAPPVDRPINLDFALETFQSPHDLTEQLLISSDDTDRMQLALCRLHGCNTDAEIRAQLARDQSDATTLIPSDEWFNQQQHLHLEQSTTWNALDVLRKTCHPATNVERPYSLTREQASTLENLVQRTIEGGAVGNSALTQLSAAKRDFISTINGTLGSPMDCERRFFLPQEDCQRVHTALRDLAGVRSQGALDKILHRSRDTPTAWVPDDSVLNQLQHTVFQGSVTWHGLEAVRELFHPLRPDQLERSHTLTDAESRDLDCVMQTAGSQRPCPFPATQSDLRG